MLKYVKCQCHNLIIVIKQDQLSQSLNLISSYAFTDNAIQLHYIQVGTPYIYLNKSQARSFQTFRHQRVKTRQNY